MEQPRNEKGQTQAEFLAAYDENAYRRPSVTVDMAVFTLLDVAAAAPLMQAAAQPDYRLGVLLVRRKDHPFIHSWALPGGFVNMEEDLLAAAERELAEETNLTGLNLRQFGTFGAPGRDPRTRVITVGHYALAPFGSLAPKAGDDAAAAGLFAVSLKLMAQCAAAERFLITLEAGPLRLQALAQRRFDTLGALPVLAPGAVEDCPAGLASDHSLVLFSALCALEAQPRMRAAELLSGGDPALRSHVKRVLDALFADFL